ncbi:MAG: S41 family peptidase [Candidatus Roizmanbacteria bacterium]|nr:S41 family peptidase [Candidatus Roizmanbacteria bacterium]
MLKRFKTLFSKRALIVITIFSIIAIAAIGGYLWGSRFPVKIPQKENIYSALLMEEFDTIQKNYWDKLTDSQLIDIYLLANQKVTGQFSQNLTKDKKGLKKILEKTLNAFDTTVKKKQYTVTLADTVLASLQPAGRSRLYSKKEEANLKNEVENKNPTIDRYKTIGTTKKASQQEIAKAYEKKKQDLEAQKTPEAKEKLAEVEQAYETLSTQQNRDRYDNTGVESTIVSKVVNGSVLYMHLTRFSPTTLDDIVSAADTYKDNSAVDALIFDLRDNIGGLIDGLPYFLGPFIGPDQYAYQFLHHGEKQDFKTQAGLLPSLTKYKQVVVLINGNSQSSAEVMAASLKKYNVGTVVGTPSKGWGTVEKVFPLKHQLDKTETFSIFLVHSLTLRDDGQPIEGKGVIPDVNITDPNWQEELLSYTRYSELVSAVKEVW